ncbi:MAG: Magnesium and cobalt efflux protein CorC [Planctomycetota bacterium]|jgi:CBS domain containing-hemolysin-like protein
MSVELDLAEPMRRIVELPDLTIADIALLSTMPPLLAVYAFFSFVETTFFALTPAERLALRRVSPRAAVIVDGLLSQPRVLLVGTMLGALLVSTSYFVVSSVLVTRFESSLFVSVVLAVVSLFGMVLSAEILPKLVGNADRVRSARFAARPTAVYCALIGPFASAIDRFVLAPIGRLSAGGQGGGIVDSAELAALLEQSAREGAIDLREREAIEGVMRLRRLRVRDVMTPRVDMWSVRSSDDEAAVRRVATEARLTHLPVIGRDVDEILGILQLKKYLLPAQRPPRTDCMEPARFVPELASLEQLLEHFRRTGTKLAIAVDEYGGTAGIVALEDCVEEIVGDIADIGEVSIDAPLEVAPGTWRVSGEMGVSRWGDAFGTRVISPRASTVAGLVMQRLSRVARPGDRVDVGNIVVEVEAVSGARIESVLVSLRGEGLRS